ncbi:MAG: methylated-DNA--[protein]-cysteine S-methyltransferase [Parashewanella sp.]
MSTVTKEFKSPCAELCAEQCWQSPVGRLLLKASNQGLTHLTVVDGDYQTQKQGDNSQTAMEILAMVISQLQQYFAGERLQFDVPLAPTGTEFQQQVWQALQGVEFGQSCSYSDIAQKINRPKAVRAVGAANGANRIAIIIPCHRIIGKSGKLTGYAYGLEMKQALLSLEKNTKD